MKKINLGSGLTKIHDFVNIDFDPTNNPDLNLDLEKDLLPFETSTVDTITAHYILEHLGEGFFHCLKEIYRVSTHGAIIDIITPHHKHNSFISDPTIRRVISPENLKLFSKKYNDICLKQKFSISRLGYYYDVDFEILSADEIPDENYVHEFNGKTIQYVQKYLNEHNNIVKDHHIRLIVIKNYDY